MADSAPKPSDEDDRGSQSVELPRLSADRAANSHELLKATFETDYSALLQRLSISLRSHDRAVEALHDAYVRLGKGPTTSDVINPIAYLFRMAMNLAHNVRLREARMLPLSSEAQQSICDDTPGPDRIVLGKIDLEKTLSPLSELPDRRREIFLARWRDEMDHEAIARAFKVHKRTVQKELVRAERFLHRHPAWPKNKQSPA